MKAHDGMIITSAPDVMWGTDGVRVFTADDGWVWTFAAVDHWNAECVGWHVCKVGSRFAALEPVAQGLRRLYGSVEADVARGRALRMDHGSQYLSDHFLNQLRYWGIHPSFGFLEEPETNGVVERWESHAEGASRLRPGLSKSRRPARGRRRVRRTLQPVLTPREAGVSHAKRSARGIRATPCRIAQTCVQENPGALEQRERQMRGFKSAAHLQRFASIHGVVQNLFRVGRHLLRATLHRVLRSRAFVEWEAVTCAC